MPPTLQELGIDKLSLDDRIALSEELDESIERDLDQQLPTEAQVAEIRRRVADSIEHPEQGIPWEVVKAEALARLRASK